MIDPRLSVLAGRHAIRKGRVAGGQRHPDVTRIAAARDLC